jgi:branched-chain amino acid transport system permease protein
VENPQLWVSAVQIGCFYALIALAFYLTLVGTAFFNFALGPYAMFAGITTSWLVIEKEWGITAAAAVALAGTVLIALLTEIIIVRPVQRRSGTGELPALVAVSGVLFAIQQFAGVFYGYGNLPGQPVVKTDLWHLGSAVIQPFTVPLVGVTLFVFVALAAWIRYASNGRLLRAVGDSPPAASLLGLPVSRIRLIAFVLSGAVAGIAGLLFSPKSGVTYASGLEWTLSGFLALVVGGTGAIWAPLLGGLILGLAQVFVPFYFGGESFQYLLVGIAMVFFAFRPEGISARRVRT